MRWLVACALAGCSFQPAGFGTTTAADAANDTGDAMRDGAHALDCPTGYDVTIADSTSQYRIIVTGGDFATQHADCNDDKVGATHLASPETYVEIMELQKQVSMLVTPAPSAQYYVGVVQQPDSPSEAANWFVFSGAALPSDLGVWAPTQPNDDLAGENNEENLGALNALDAMHDATGNYLYGAICECDGRPVDPTIASYIP
jgi:hypothetical protein